MIWSTYATLCEDTIDSRKKIMHLNTNASENISPSRLEELDGTDFEILELLRTNSRRTLAEIGRRVSMSSPAVKRRIHRLESLGVITGYTVKVDYSALGRPVDAFTELRFAGSTKVADIKSVADGLPEVEEVYTTAGDPDALVRIRVRDMHDLTRVVDLLRKSGRVTGTKTLMVLDALHPDQTFDP
jgi:Lrp/AsnC family leucine-responsive transcriptional regulator